MVNVDRMLWPGVALTEGMFFRAESAISYNDEYALIRYHELGAVRLQFYGTENSFTQDLFANEGIRCRR
jgi:hypothetical protein